MGEIFIEFIIFLGDSLGVIGGLLAIYHVANGPKQWAVLLAGGVLLLAAAAGLFVASAKRNYEARRWLVVTLMPGAALPGSTQAARSLQKRAKWVLRAAATLFAIAASFTLTVVILAVYESNRDVDAGAFKSLAIVAVSTYAIAAAQIMVELVLIYKAVGLELTGLRAKFVYGLPPVLEVVGTVLLIVVAIWDPWDPLEFIGLVIAGAGVALGMVVFVHRAFIAPRRQPAQPPESPEFPTKIALGIGVRVVREADLRPKPGVSHDPIRKLPVETVLKVVAGPVEVDGRSWWQVQDAYRRRGWVESYNLEPKALRDLAGNP